MTHRSAAILTTAKPQSGSFIEQQIGHLLRRAYALARKNSAAALAVLGDISPVQASALATLLAGALTQAELGRRIGMESANTHTLIKRMVVMGLIRTRPDAANRRLSLVEHTAGGRRLALQLDDVLARAADATLAPLSIDERETLIALLRLLIEHDTPEQAPHDGQS